jgi:predicted nucleotidyltransferase
MRFGLDEIDIEKINSAFALFPEVERVLLYGSRAKGTYKLGSDIDLTLIGKYLTLDTINAIETQIDDLLLPYLFDISIFSQIDNPDLVEHINRIGKLFYEKEAS